MRGGTGGAVHEDGGVKITCPECGREFYPWRERTQHRVDKGLVGPCLDCILKYDNRVFDLDELREKLSPRQAGLFGDAT